MCSPNSFNVCFTVSNLIKICFSVVLNFHVGAIGNAINSHDSFDVDTSVPDLIKILRAVSDVLVAGRRTRYLIVL